MTQILDGGTPTDAPAAVMTDETREAFEAEIRRLRASRNSGPLDRAVSGLGVLLAVVGLVTILVCYGQATAASDVRDQLDSLILAAFGGSLTLLGSVLYVRNSLTRFLRYWLLRLIYEQRDITSNR
jgi:hypothetical protein